MHCMKGRSSTKMGMRVRTMKSMKSQKARPPTFLRAISFTCRLSRYQWPPRARSKHTTTTFRAGRETVRERERDSQRERDITTTTFRAGRETIRARERDNQRESDITTTTFRAVRETVRERERERPSDS